jgi:hypothetical protein
MNTHVEKQQNHKKHSAASMLYQQHNVDESPFQFEDNRPKSIAQRKFQEQNKKATEKALQKKNKTNDLQTMQLKMISHYTSGVIQLAMNRTEADKLKAVLQKYTGKIKRETLETIFNQISQKYDTLEAATNDLEARLAFAVRQEQTLEFRVNASAYPRVHLAGDSRESRNELKETTQSTPPTKKGYDLSYRQHTDAIDAELDRFLPKGDFDVSEQRERYYQAADASQSQVSPRKKKGMFTHTAPGGLPMTSMTPDMMKHYHAMHYKPDLVKPDETQSTRTYEHQYTDRARQSMNVETFRAFFLPPGSKANDGQELMVNTLGASLDSNTPTRGNTIGSGVVNKTIYKHFQRSLELLNSDLDKGPMSGDIGNFERRTQLHIQYLRRYSLRGMRANEEAHAKQGGKVPWQTLQPIIQQTGLMINGMLNTLATQKKLPDYNIDIKDNLILEKLRIIAVMLGVMIKTEKRLLVNHIMANHGNEATGQAILTMIGNLAAIEQNINQALSKNAASLKVLEKGGGASKASSMSLSPMASKSHIEQQDRDFDRIFLTNNCLPEAILGRKLTLEEARRLRLSLIENGQQLGGFLDADQPVIQTIARQFPINRNIVIYEGQQIWRRFLVSGGNVLDITLSNIPIPENTALNLERINRNHFIRKR